MKRKMKKSKEEDIVPGCGDSKVTVIINRPQAPMQFPYWPAESAVGMHM